MERNGEENLAIPKSNIYISSLISIYFLYYILEIPVIAKT